MDKNTSIFERILQIIEYYNIKSVNSFAKDYLGYDSSEKIARLKDTSKRPSVDILEDISNKFENIDLNWLINGTGLMLKNAEKRYFLGEEKSIFVEENRNKYKQNDENSSIWKEQLKVKDKMIEDLLKHQEVLLNQISKLTDKLK